MSHRTLFCFALHWGHCTPAFREAREQLTNKISGVIKSYTLPFYRLAAHFATYLFAVWNLMNLQYMFCGMICHVYVPSVK
jgi:hypothetical protein